MSAPANSSAIIDKVKVFVKSYMHGFHDSTHDYIHVERVLGLVHKILKEEQHLHPEIPYNPLAVTLAALMHDVGNHQHQDLDGAEEESPSDEASMVSSTLMWLKPTPSLARHVQKIVRNVAYVYEEVDPQHVQRVIRTHPELAIVQIYGAKNKGKGNMQDVVRREFEKVYRLEGTIKTEAGRRLAEVMMERCRFFAGWWAEEQGVVGDLDLEALGKFEMF
ncbi:hypothetical protein MMC14_004294 [Varicellaria rhodocarpa]|nr:hypothetical protein [Varicellaria rhodocarpa]